MRPQLVPLRQATCRNLFNPRRSLGEARNFAATTARPLRGDTTRPALLASQSATCLQQQRWITQNYIQRMKDGEKEWAEFAKEIKEGKRKNFAQHLEERGLIHDVVGYVRPRPDYAFASACVRLLNDILTSLVVLQRTRFAA
jgi:tyrosyl-tRNA synthetase